MGGQPAGDLSRFLSVYACDGDVPTAEQVRGLTSLDDLRACLGGRSFGRGIYRIHDAAEAVQSAGRIDDFFGFGSRYEPFGRDWLGREFALDAERADGGGRQVTMLEPGTGDRLEIPAALWDFHNEELVSYSDAALASESYSRWLDEGREPPGRDQCVGYRLPLFLGGSDTFDNFEPIDVDVYWTLHAQLWHQTFGEGAAGGG
jgi:hypothetical protein